jgi:multidrug efflux system outer membrane protein
MFKNMILFQKKFVLLVVAALAVLPWTGCKVGPKYARPAITNEKSFRFSNSFDTLSMADLAWVSLFKDTTLHRLVNTALKNNYDMQMAYARVEQARANFKMARGDQWPMIGASAYGGWNRAALPNGAGNTEYSAIEAVGTISWEIDLWGKLRHAKEAARAGLFAEEAYQQSVRITLIHEVVNSYFNLLEYDNELTITRENIGIREKSLELVKAKLIAGTASGLVVAQAEAELALAKAQVPRLEMLTGIEENYLSTLLGESPHGIRRGGAMLDQLTTPSVSTPGIPSHLIIRRPDIIMAEQSLIAANANIGVARAMMLPSLSISGSAGAAFNPTSFVYNAMGNLVAPIFNGGKLRSNVKMSEARKEEMLANYGKTIIHSLKEVSDALLQVQKLKDIVDREKETEKAARTAFELSDQLYNAGYASYLDVINAQALLFQSQVSLSQAQSDELTAMVTLYSALGGGWK